MAFRNLYLKNRSVATRNETIMLIGSILEEAPAFIIWPAAGVNSGRNQAVMGANKKGFSDNFFKRKK